MKAASYLEKGRDEMRAVLKRNHFGVLTMVAAALLAVCLLLVLVRAHPSEAAFPGQNGKLVYTSDGIPFDHVNAINPDGSDNKGAGCGGIVDQHPALSPDGTKVASDTRDLGSVSGGISICNLDGSDNKWIDTGLYAVFYPTWAPTGDKLAFIGQSTSDSPRYDLYTMRVDGSGLDNVTEGRVENISRRPAFSPSSLRIAFSGQNPDYMDDPNLGTDRSQDIFLIDADGNNLTPVTGDVLNQPLREDTDPTWSPDGNRIAFTRQESDGTPQKDIFTMGSGGSGLGNVTNTEDTEETTPAWSPNNDKIAYVSNKFQDHWDLRIAAADGSGVAVVPNASSPTYIDWGVADNAAPQVQSTTPANGAVGVKANLDGFYNVEGIFSEPMDHRTIGSDYTDPDTFTLTKQGSSTPVDAHVSYDSEAKKAILSARDLEAGTTYVAILKGGSSGVKDFYGNPLPEDKSWNFATAPLGAPGCTITGTSSPETLTGTSADDIICGGRGGDTIKGGGGNDILRGEGGADKLYGEAGDDTFDGGPGTDAANFSGSSAGITASLTTNTATGEGSDTLTAIENLVGSSKSDTLTGSEANNNINGGGLGDSLTGMGGADTLNGAGGPDSVNSQDGVNDNDSLNGGAGTDTKVTDATELSIVNFP